MITGLFLLPHVIILFSTTFLSVVLTYACLRKQTRLGNALGWLMAAVAVSTLASSIEAISIGQSYKIFWAQVEYTGFVNIPPLMLFFALIYSQIIQRFNKKLLLLWTIPLVTLILVWTNDLHGLIWPGFSVGSQANNTLIYQHGPGFWVFLVYLYSVLAVSISIIIREYILSSSAFKTPIGITVISSLFPCAAGALYLLGLNPIPGLDLVPASCAVAGVGFAWSVFHLQSLNPVPAAREVLVDNLLDGVVILDLNNHIVEINTPARAQLNLLGQVALGLHIDSILTLPIKIASLSGGAPVEITLPDVSDPDHQSNNVRLRYIELQISRIYRRPGKPVGSLLIIRDITRRKTVEIKLQQTNQKLREQLDETRILRDQLKEQAMRDFLTGLYNRRYLDENLDRELARATFDRRELSLLLIDLDYLKHINDEYGHLFGDVMLQQLGELIKTRTRREDIACRFGGDEFMIILPGVDGASALKRAEILRREFQNIRVPFQDTTISSTISIGIAVFPIHGMAPDELTRAADTALYQSKTNGRNRVSLYAPSEPVVPAENESETPVV